MAYELSPEERETIISMTGDNHDAWIVYSDDPYWQRRLEKLGIQPFEVRGAGRKYRLRADQVLLRKGKPLISDEVRQARAARLQSQSSSGAGILEANRAR